MASSTKAMLLIITVLAIVGMPLVAKGARDLKNKAVVHPENLYGGFGTGIIYPTPGGVRVVAGAGVTGHGSSIDFCSNPGLSCVRVEPTNPGGGSVGSVGGTPLPLP